VFMMHIRDQINYVSESIEPLFLATFERLITKAVPGALRYSDVVADRTSERRRQRVLEVWSIPLVERLTGLRMEDSALYPEHIKPAGMTHGPMLSTALPTGEALLGVGHSHPDRDPFGEEGGLELMRMLLPAFKAGVHAVVRWDAERAALARALDALGEAILVCDAAGRERRQSRRLTELLAGDPERGRLLAEMRSLAGALVRLRVPRFDPALEPVGSREIATATARYRVRGSYVEFGMVDAEGAILVVLERFTPELPPAPSLMEHYRLTQREAQVALLLVRGLSSTEIAAQLSVSPHTVRHHAEWVFAKLGIHSRKALGLKLLAGLS